MRRQARLQRKDAMGTKDETRVVPSIVFTAGTDELAMAEPPAEFEHVGEGLSPVFQPNPPKRKLSHGRARIARHITRSLSSLQQKGAHYYTFYKDPHNDPNVTRVLDAVRGDQEVETHPVDNKLRRTILLQRPSRATPFGFTLERRGELVQVRFVANVAVNGPAAKSGLRAGDVLLSLNGRMVTDACHESVVDILAASTSLRAVILFDDAVSKVELALRRLKLEQLLWQKEAELLGLERAEWRIVKRASPSSSINSFPTIPSSASQPSFHSASDEPPGRSREDGEEDEADAFTFGLPPLIEPELDELTDEEQGEETPRYIHF